VLAYRAWCDRSDGGDLTVPPILDGKIAAVWRLNSPGLALSQAATLRGRHAGLFGVPCRRKTDDGTKRDEQGVTLTIPPA
jgi:hypothetical protein